MKRFAPDVFLIGAPKCGTTALSHWLRSHPDVNLPDRKEPHHFSGPYPNDRHKNPIMDPKEYRALYKGPGLSLDASTSYLASEKAYHAIKEL
ncbi:MAG: sulfotransferase, partial [Thermoplasmatota archaeon]